MRSSVQTSGIGGVPFNDLQQAFDHIESYYSIPFLPEINSDYSNSQLPPFMQRILSSNLYEHIIAKNFNFVDWNQDQIIAEINDVALEDLGISDFFKRFSQYPVVKLQIMGPHCLASLIDAQNTKGSRCFQRFARAWLKELALRMLQHSSPHQKVYFFWDEPILGFDSRETGYVLYDLPHVQFGIHCCDKNFPVASRRLNKSLVYSSDCIRPPLDDLKNSSTRANHHFIGLLDAQQLDFGKAEEIMKLYDYQNGIIITPTCGTGRLSPKQEIAVASLLKKLQMT